MALYKFEIVYTDYSSKRITLTNKSENYYTVVYPDNNTTVNPSITDLSIYFSSNPPFTVSCYLLDDSFHAVGNPLFYFSTSYRSSGGVCILSYFDESGNIVNYVNNYIQNYEFTVSDTPSKSSCIKTSAKLGGARKLISLWEVAA